LALETYRTWTRFFELQRYYSWIVIRFHLSTQMHQFRAYGKRYDFSWLEDRLLPLGFRLVFCSRSADSFESAREERLKVSGNPKQYVDLDAFVSEQIAMKELVCLFNIPFAAKCHCDHELSAMFCAIVK